MAPKKPIKPAPRTETRTETIAEPKVKSTKAKPSNEKIGFQSLKSFITDEKTRYIIGILLLFVVLYFTLAMLSYFFTGAADQSKMDLPWSELKEKRSEIHNWTSVMGALISETLINKWFGLSAFFIVIFAAIIAFRLMKKKLYSMWKGFFHCSFWLIWMSVTFGFMINPLVDSWLFFSPGGQHGEAISNILKSYIGNPGTFFLLLGMFLTYSIISFNATLPFIKGLFKRNEKPEEVYAKETVSDNNFDNDELEFEPSVAVGTEIIPEEWVTNATKADDTVLEMPIEIVKDLENESASNNNEVLFEVEKPTVTEENKAVDAETTFNTADENEDPNYNLSRLGKYDPTLDLSHYTPPTLNLLKIYGTDNDTQIDMVEQNANKKRIITTLQNYGIEIDTIKATVGPTITLYEIVPKAGVRISKIRNLEYDIMLSLAATGIRIIAPIPGKGTIGIEVPNSDPQVVSMHSVIASKKFQESKFELPVAFGRTITNEIFMVDLAKMPHLLVAGATGQGKSVGLNAIITSLLYKKHPSELKLVLVDPKKVEFNIYGDIEKHFLAKLPDGEDAIITDTTKVVETLNSLCKEMDDRYDLLKKAHVRNIKEYNEKFFNRQLNPEKGHRFLPYVVVIVDEFGDLIMTAGKEVELPIARIAQLARAVGIHMIIATQRPSVNIITGVIKANFPARVAFRVSSMIDSRTILDAPGANQLVGRGDMLFSQGNDLIRVQCAFVDTPEVENIVHHISGQQSYPTAFYLPEYIRPEGDGIDASSVDMSKRDPLFEEAARLIVANQQGSTSLIQRKFSIGYNRAGRIVDQLEVAGIVGPFEGSKARQVLVMDDYHLEQILKNL